MSKMHFLKINLQYLVLIFFFSFFFPIQNTALHSLVRQVIFFKKTNLNNKFVSYILYCTHNADKA